MPVLTKSKKFSKSRKNVKVSRKNMRGGANNKINTSELTRDEEFNKVLNNFVKIKNVTERNREFRRLASIYHPDKNSTDGATERFQKLQTASQKNLSRLNDTNTLPKWKNIVINVNDKIDTFLKTARDLSHTINDIYDDNSKTYLLEITPMINPLKEGLKNIILEFEKLKEPITRYAVEYDQF